MDTETYAERNERLGSQSGRQEQLALVLAALEEPRGDAAEPDLEAARLLLVDAIMDHDDYALRLGVDGLHRLMLVWSSTGANEEPIVEARGELRGLHNVASMALERMVPLAILAEISPDTLPHRILSYVAENPGCSNDDLVHATDTDKTQVSRAGRRLAAAGLVRKQRTGTRNAWQLMPRGAGALHAVDHGATRPTGLQRAKA